MKNALMPETAEEQRATEECKMQVNARLCKGVSYITHLKE
jgi:hypothetical protein